jgi:hypothetical protein
MNVFDGFIWYWAGLLIVAILAVSGFGFYILSKPPPSHTMPTHEQLEPNNLIQVLAENDARLISWDRLTRSVTIMDPSIRIVDACNYSTVNVFLINTGEMYLFENDFKCVRSNNVKLDRIVSFDETLMGVCNKSLYSLVSDVDDVHWTWEKVDWTHRTVEYLSVTMDGNHLFIWDGQHGYIYSVSKIEGRISNHLRVYGKDTSSFIEYGESTKIYPSQSTLPKGEFGMLSCNDQLTIGKIGHMAILDYVPFLF